MQSPNNAIMALIIITIIETINGMDQKLNEMGRDFKKSSSTTKIKFHNDTDLVEKIAKLTQKVTELEKKAALISIFNALRSIILPATAITTAQAITTTPPLQPASPRGLLTAPALPLNTWAKVTSQKTKTSKENNTKPTKTPKQDKTIIITRDGSAIRKDLIPHLLRASLNTCFSKPLIAEVRCTVKPGCR